MTDNIDIIKKQLRQRISLISKAMQSTIPRKVGVIAVQHTRENFRQSGFVDGGLHPWKPAQRQSGKGTDARYGTLTSRRNHLMMSTDYDAQPGKVTVYNDVEYARAHNEGGQWTTQPAVTPRLRKYAWYRYYQLTGIKRGMGKRAKANRNAKASPEALMWKSIALTKKTRLTIRVNMPKRTFLAPSKELTEKVRNTVLKEIENIIKQ